MSNSPQATAIDLDLSSLLDMEGLARAVESEDDLACVLRCHLVLERTLHFYLDQKRVGEIADCITDPWQFAQALSLAVAFGLPPILAASYQQINAIRNKMAHGKIDALGADHVEPLAARVNRLVELSPEFRFVQDRFVSIHKLHQGTKVPYGKGGTRMDFLICAMALLQYASDWMARDAIRRHMQGRAPSWV
jgi:hypothetical protein